MSIHPKKALLFPALAGFPDAVHDLADVPENAASVRLIEKVHNFQDLPALPALTRLWCFGIDAQKLRTISSCRSLTHLFIETLRAEDLSALARRGMLESLSVETAPKIKSLDGIADFGSLDGLAVLNFRGVGSLQPLSQLTRLQALAVAGSVWTRMTVETLAPLSALKALRFLHLTNLKATDNSLEPLRELTDLEELECANFYPMEQFAKLAAALPQTRCTWFSPAVPFPNFPCKKCGQSQRVMLAGKGSSTLCRVCDESRVRKHEDAFRAIASQR